MIIRPKNRAPIEEKTGVEQDLWIFPLYQTREDYAQDHGGKEPPPPDPGIRAKHWYDPAYSDVAEDDGKVVVYNVVERNPRTGAVVVDEQRRPRIGQMVMPTWIAGRVNIPYGTANEFPPEAVISRLAPYPVPIRGLAPVEELEMSSHPFQPGIVVRRKDVKELDFSDTAKVLELVLVKLEEILMAVKKPS